MRAFVAVDVPDPRAPSDSTASAHLTLKFLGEISVPLAESLGAAVRSAVASLAPFSLELRGVGAFPDASHPRVVWAGVGEGAERVTDLAHRVDEAGTTVGVRPEPRPFTPHVTLLRVRGPRDTARAQEWLACGPEHVFGRTEVRDVVLTSSELRREGAVHRAIDRFPLQGVRTD
ncbi:MAG: RNA 2',3'-cyclic phosphodiesterase [Thermoplasmata archaeon]|nr:RNA 2',3'-cyclic phosphodiesterase [Thermoplasmata archaeon]